MRSLILVIVLPATAVPVAAQTPGALAAGPRATLMPPVVQRALNAAALSPSYRVRLVSDWPQYSAGALGCVNGGQEMLEGTLSQGADGAYSGQLRRHATIYFCGVHGGTEGACALTLTSEGEVAARGLVTQEAEGWNDPWLLLRWHTPEGASQVEVGGDCPARFNQALERMYLGVSHSLEFSLPAAGAGPRTLRLDDYGWIVDVR